MQKWLTLLCIAAASAAQASDRFTLQAEYSQSQLKTLRFDYGTAPQPTGVLVDGTLLPGSGCFARLPGSDNLTAFLASIQTQPGYFSIADTRKRMQEAMIKTKLDIWQEVLCVAPVPFPETVKENPGKWSSIPIYLNGERQGAWNDVFTVVRPNHLYSVTVRPRGKGAQ